VRRLLVATGNRGKVVELHELLGHERFEVVSLTDVGVESPEETGTTFRENAVLKARLAARASGLPTVADDSGIVVDALGGEPGVRSARFAGDGATDADNRALLLERLRGTEPDRRAARFVCVIAVAEPDGTTETFEGFLEGRVAEQERGSGGFGYDSIFLLDDGRTVAELAPEEKNRMSHRARALEKALPYIHSLFDEDA